MKKTKKNITIAGALALAMVLDLFCVFTTVAGAYNTPSVKPPSEHPRVLFTSADIPKINAFLDNGDDETKNARTWFRRRVNNREGDGDNGGGDLTNASSGWNYKMLGNLEAKALCYVLGRTVTMNGRTTTAQQAGELAVEYLLTYLNTVNMSKDTGNKCRDAGMIIYVAAEVYDWCYPLLTAEQKTTIRTKVAELGGYFEAGWPPTGQKATVGHGSEAQLLRDGLAFAIAAYDEDSSLWNEIGGKFYDEYVPVRDNFLPSGYNLQGSGYGPYRLQWDLWAYALITGMGAGSPFNKAATQGLKDSAYQIIYTRRPDGQFFRDGDTPISYDDYFSVWEQHNVSMLGATIAQNPYIKDDYLNTRPKNNFYYDSAMMYIVLAGLYDNVSVNARPAEILPNTHYFGSPAGIMVARTNWDTGENSNAAVAFMKIGEQYKGNHQPLNSGTFQLYYKGILASASGIYQGANSSNSGAGASGYNSNHRYYYAIQTVAYNGLLINNWNQLQTSDTDMLTSFEPRYVTGVKTVAKVDSYDIDQTNVNKPNYSYIKGDISDAYEKASKYKRSFMFLDLKREDVPAALVVFDYVSASGYNKRWLLHSQTEPIITSNGSYGRTVFTNTASDSSGSYNGKLTVDTLLPQNPSITSIGGSGNYSKAANGTNYEAYESENKADEGNTYRIEISSSGSQFLNIMQVSDADKENYLPVSRIGGNDVVGVTIADRVVTFNKTSSIFTGDFSFSAPKGTYEYTVCDVKRGAWIISGDSSFSEYDIVGTSDDEDSNVLHFSKTLNASGELYFRPYNSGGGFSGSGISPSARSMGYYFGMLYSGTKEVSTDKYPIIDSSGRPLVAASDMAKILGAEMTVEGNTVIFAKDDKTCSFTVGSATITKDGDTVEKDDEAAPVLVNNEIYVSPISLSSYFYAKCVVDNLIIRILPDVYDGVFSVQYSVDGTDFNKTLEMSNDIYEYDVVLPENAKYVYVKMTELPKGWTAPKILRYGYAVLSPTDWFGGDTDILVGTAGYNKSQFATNSLRQHQVKVKALKQEGEVYKIPVKNERTTVTVPYTHTSGAEQIYELNFRAKQPRLTSFTDNMDADYGKVIFIGGAAVNNDNGTVLYTGDTKATGKQSPTRALGYVTEPLLGASMFVLPKISDAAKKSSDMFHFTADHGGTVYMIVDDPLSGTNYDSWTELNNGIDPDDLENWRTSNTRFLRPRTYNSFSNTDYWAVSLQWYYDGNDNSYSSEYNSYRATEPGVDGNISSANIKNSYLMHRVFSKEFEAEEEVIIPGWGNSSADSAILIQWNTEPLKTTVYGDVTGDGKITSKDDAFLARYLAHWTGYDERTVDLNAADTNADGNVTIKDNAILSRHIANWAGYEVLPLLK